MTNPTRLRSAVCIAALIAGGAAHADVTAAEVWDDWKAQLDLYGEDGLSIGSEVSSGGTLTVSDVVTTIEDTDIKVVASLGDLVFTEQGDGSVVVTVADSYPVTMTVDNGVVINIVVSQPDMGITVTGDADTKTYDIIAPKATIALQGIEDGDVTFSGDASLALNELAGTYVSEAGDIRNLAYDLTTESVDFLIDFEIPESDGQFVTASGKIDQMTMQGDVAIPEGLDFNDPDTLFAEGFATKGGYDIESAAYIFDINADGDQLTGSVSTGGAELEYVFSSQIMSYDGSTDNVALNVQSGDFPFPVELTMAQYGVSLTMPTGKTDAPVDYGFSLDLIDFTVNDLIWGLFDSGNILPRDPATIQIDLAGKAQALFDMFDPDQALEIANADTPYFLESLNLNTLKVSAVGADIDGSGAFTFDNTDTETFDGLPRPEGAATIEVKGLNGLLDNLVAMGLIPEDQVLTARFMMGAFVRNIGDDHLATDLEINEQGQFLVNGQRLPF